MLKVIKFSFSRCNFDNKPTCSHDLQLRQRKSVIFCRRLKQTFAIKFNFIHRRYLRLGETPNKNASIIDIRVIRIELHPKAGWTNLRNNLAILFLERDVEFKKDSGEFS